MKTTIIIGHAGHGSTCLSSAIERVLAQQSSVVIATIDDVKKQQQEDYFKEQKSRDYCLTEFEPEPIQNQIFDKQKSKYHK